MNRKKIFALIFILCAVGCANQKTWVYRPNTYSTPVAPSNMRAVVVPFQDQRENLNSNKLALYLIPLFPYGWGTFNVPEGQQMHVGSGLWINYKPTEDFPKALAEEISASGLFKEANFDFREGDADIVIKGKILSTRYYGTIISYGLSAYGPLLWLIGLPSGKVSNELSLELSCLNADTKKTIFSKIYTAPVYSKVAWIYNLPNDFNYSEMIKGIYKNFIEDMRASIKEGTGSR